MKTQTEKQYTIDKSTAVVYKIRIKKPFNGWASITIREWPNGGSFDCQSDYGNYSYSWSSIGDRTLREFLWSLDYHYFMGKTRGGYGQIFSLEKSLAELRAEIIRQRKARDLGRNDARECWAIVKQIDAFSGNNSCEYTRALEFNNSLVEMLYGGDYSCIPFREVDDPECVGFWERIWPIACDQWKKELIPRRVVDE